MEEYANLGWLARIESLIDISAGLRKLGHYGDASDALMRAEDMFETAPDWVTGETRERAHGFVYGGKVHKG